jgi:hypothetical protein
VNDLIPKPEVEEVDKEMNDVIIQWSGFVLFVVLSGERMDVWTFGYVCNRLVKGLRNQ